MKIEDFVSPAGIRNRQPSQLTASLSSAQQQTNELKQQFTAVFMI
ncbi:MULTISPECIES: hypothetical protein [Rhizobium]|jgi:hypothetical protein|nr:hypothetical protein [Rhizobium sp. PRIMUS64]